MIDVECLKTIQTQWQELAAAFKRLSDTLAVDDPRRVVVGNPHGEARGFEWWAVNQVSALQSAYEVLQYSPTLDVLVQMPAVLRASQQVRRELEAQFTQTGMFGIQQVTDNLDEMFCRTLLNDLSLFIGDYLRELVAYEAEC